MPIVKGESCRHCHNYSDKTTPVYRLLPCIQKKKKCPFHKYTYTVEIFFFFSFSFQKLLTETCFSEFLKKIF